MIRIKAVAIVASVLFSIAAAHAEAPYAVAYEREVLVTMRDGVKLRADIFRPDAPGRFPVLLQRTPYDKNRGVEFGLKAAARGYVVISEDVRGRYASEGEWYPFKHEQEDGYDTVEWAAALPYADGRVGMFGASYVGATQLLAAIAQPPHLAGINPMWTGSNYHANWTYQGGAFQQWFNQSWMSWALARDTADRTLATLVDPEKGAPALPLVDYPLFSLQASAAQPTTTKDLAPYYLDWLAHPAYDDYWKRYSIEENFEKIKVPALHVGGWYDIFEAGSVRNFTGLKAQGATAAARDGQRLIVAPGGHAGLESKIGAVDLGAAAKFDIDGTTLDWYDYLFKGVKNRFASDDRVSLFVLGSNTWRQERDWPLARAKTTRYYLHAPDSLAATSPAGSQRSAGTLTIILPRAEKPDAYVYDPNDPVPTIGGSLCCEPLKSGIGIQDQQAVEARGDVLVYTTPAFAKDTEVTGPVSLDLYVSSSAVDTDFTGMLVDVWPNGFVQNLTSGILRLRYRQSMATAALAKPGKIYRITVDLWDTSNVFRAGHKLRLEVSSSNFPRFDRNLNTGEDQARSKRAVAATNTIYHDAAHPSALIVPVVE